MNNVLSENECSRIIQRSEDVGYKQALVNIGVGEVLDSDYRNSDRCIIDDVEFAQILFERIKPFLPASMYGNWKLCGLNERMRILKYGKGKEHVLRHEGAKVSSGRKYAIRSDVMYECDEH